jgi:ferrous iron transport protein B
MATAVRPPEAGAATCVATEGLPGGRGALAALVGPPNSGKSTLFNQLTGLRQKVGNYPGVTVEKKIGLVRLEDGRELALVDLPGLHGFSARTADERVTRDVLEGRLPDLPAPDAVVLVVDSTRLETQLMLAEPVLALGLPTLLVLNMGDELAAGGGSVDGEELALQLGVEVVKAVARAGVGVEAVRRFLSSVHPRQGEPAWIRADATSPGPPPTPSDATSQSAVHPPPRLPSHRVQLPVVELFVSRRGRVRAATLRAGYLAPLPSRVTDRLDALFLHRYAGPAIFLLLVALVFQAIFTWAAPLMDGVEAVVTTSGEWLRPRLPEGWLRSLLIDGIWMGVGSVVVFLPQILVLFFFLGLLEDSGYMARAAVIADRSMHRAGLQGRAFLPLISGFACAVPAILAARTVADERDRLATIFVVPFMTCSARLPVYALLIAAFVPERPLLGPFLGTRAATLMGLYALGAAAAVATAFVLKRTLLRGRSSQFVMELPPYRIPTLKAIGLRLLDRSRIFLWRIGRIILVVSVVLWGLMQLPRVGGEAPELEASLLGRAGQVMEPAIAPLGFDWKVGVGLISSLAAREVIVGTLGTIYGVENADEGSMEIQAALQRELDFGGALALLVFFAFALQCVSTIAVTRRETGGWKWPALQFSYMLLLAYSGAWVANAVW